MRTRLGFLALALFAIAIGGAFAQTPSQAPFKVEFDAKTGVELEKTGNKGVRVTVKFWIVRLKGKGDESGKDYKVVIEEDHREVQRIDVPEPKIVDKLSAVLAIDISGSKDRTTGEKNAQRRIEQSGKAADDFLTRLPAKADCGLILFDHQVLKPDTVAPTQDREPLKKLIKKMQPRGGTAYLDAAKEAVALLAKQTFSDRKKVAVLMTDGVDVRSKAKLADVINDAKKHKVSLYTIGIGEPGKLDPVTSVLVLDRSASMEEPADNKDPRSKIVALRNAASLFVEMLPKSATTTVLPFGSSLGTAKDFSSDKNALKTDIQAVTTEGETKMLDAACEAIAMLAAAKRPGKNAIVVMTDGIDNQSRMRPEDVIAKAKEAGVTVHMMLFGKEEELQQAMGDMKKIAKETGGTFNHAKNEKALIKVFEDMSIVLHDDGIDETSLKKLAKETGGEYYHAKDIGNLHLITEQISQEVMREPKIITFNSPAGFDGANHHYTVTLKKMVVGPVGQIVETVVEKHEADLARPGLVVAEMHPIIYLGLFTLLVLMATVPPTLGRIFRSMV
jgi:VWFA-related protein